MKKKIYKIGTFKNGQHFAKAVVISNNLLEIELEFIRMYKKTNFFHSEGDFESCWEAKRFSEDTNNVAVFICKDEEEPCITRYAPLKSNIM